MARLLRDAWITLPWFALSCGQSGRPDSPACEVMQRLVGGSPSADRMGMSSDQKRAIGRVRAAGGPPDYFCTGTLVAPSWVLTARHCNQGGAFTFEPPGDVDHPVRVFSVLESQPNPDHDALLLRLDGAASAEPLFPRRDSNSPPLLGAPADLAGYGVDANGAPASSLNFLVERITAVDAESIVVDGLGRSGACIGDSGGPMLLRDERGVLVIAGILSTGSATCTGVDRYLRADVIRAWVLGVVGVEPSASACGALTLAGLCRGGEAIRCDAGSIVAETCGGGTVCGWSAAAHGYRCLRPEEDACERVDDLGECTNSTARSCEDGHVSQRDCAACDTHCGWDATEGRFGCL
jgi:hypothetical protein